MQLSSENKLLTLSFLVQSAKVGVWLQKSLIKCKEINFSKKNLSEDDRDNLENLASRFSRHSDILIQKIFRLIERIELETPGSIIDSIHRAAKRDLIADEQQFIDIRELRIQIAHEYQEETLIHLYQDVFKLTPVLLETQLRVEKYLKEKWNIN